MKESKVFLIRRFKTGKLTNLRKITFVCREKEFYQHPSIGIWWKKNYGVGVAYRPNKQFKYFMIGLSFFKIKSWLEFTWIGYCKEIQPLQFKDE